LRRLPLPLWDFEVDGLGCFTPDLAGFWSEADLAGFWSEADLAGFWSEACWALPFPEFRSVDFADVACS
jgi:hypothetical protein